MTLLLREADVQRLLTLEDTLAAVELAFREWGEGRAQNQPRRRVQGGVFLATMSASLPAAGLVGLKAYTAGRAGARFWVHLFDAATGKLRAVIEADHLGRLRTGAASGLATRYLANPAAAVLAQFGTGTQALTQALAVAAVRPIREIRVVSRDPRHRQDFSDRLGKEWHGCVREVTSAEAALHGADVVTTITSSPTPLFPGARLTPGQHVNAAGSNWPDRREIDAEAVGRARLVVADDAEAARVEAGDLLLAERRGCCAGKRFDRCATSSPARSRGGRRTSRSSSRSGWRSRTSPLAPGCWSARSRAGWASASLFDRLVKRRYCVTSRTPNPRQEALNHVLQR